ncbi:MAG: hypothetical protein ABI181_12935 [Mycobacteriaceae bacterium]
MGPSELVLAPALLGLLAWLLYWTFGTSKAGPNRAGEGDGLLTVVGLVPQREAAVVLRSRLSDAGLRSTLSGSSTDGYRVLVFPADEAAARTVLSRNALG